jgi:hypothetical protein
MTKSLAAGEETPVAYITKEQAMAALQFVAPGMTESSYVTLRLFILQAEAGVTRPTPAAAADTHFDTELADDLNRIYAPRSPAAGVPTDRKLFHAGELTASNVGGVWSAYEEELRDVMGNTNYQSVRDAIAALDEALAEFSSPVAPVGVPPDEVILGLWSRYGSGYPAAVLEFARALLSHSAAPGGEGFASRLSQPSATDRSELPRGQT